jgi:hypothetical protein
VRSSQATPAAVDKSAPGHLPESLRASAFQADRGRLGYIELLACALPTRVHHGAETPSTISLKQASTIAEIRTHDEKAPEAGAQGNR